MTDDFIDVVAAIIRSPDRQRVLLALRGSHQHQGDRWEFPGGKVDPGETVAAALRRELEEELGITPLAHAEYSTIEHRYADKAVRLHFREVTVFSGSEQGREGQEIRWVSSAELAQLDFPEANLPVVDRLLGR